MQLQYVRILSSDGEVTEYINIANTEDADEILFMVGGEDYFDDEVIISYGKFVDNYLIDEED
jgi:hypothetical protein